MKGSFSFLMAIGHLDISDEELQHDSDNFHQKKQNKWKTWCWYQIGVTDHFVGYRVQQFATDQSGKSPKGVYSSACLDLSNKWMIFVSRKGLLWYLPNQVPAHQNWKTAKHFSFTSALFCRTSNCLRGSIAKACEINVAESFCWYGFKHGCMHLTELPFQPKNMPTKGRERKSTRHCFE